MVQQNSGVRASSWRGGLRGGFQVWGLALVAGFLGTAGVSRAHAAEEEDPLVKKVAEHEALVTQHAKEKAAKALLEDAKIACALHKEVMTRDDLRKRVLTILETVVRTVKEDSERKSALEAVGSTGDLEAMKIVRPYLRQPDKEKTNPVLMCAIRVAGQLPVSDSVETLLTMVEDSKELSVSVAAMEALGAFGKVKNKRAKILVALCKTVAKWTPAGVKKPHQGQDSLDPTSGSSGGGEIAQRWTALAPVLPKALNQLTGQNVNTAEQWIQAVKDAPDPGRFFPKD